VSSRDYLAIEAPYLQPPPGRRYVRSFLFSRRIDALFAQVHPIARTILMFCLSGAQLQTMNTANADPASAILLWIVALVLFLTSGLNGKIARWYIILTLPTLFSLFVTWFLFNPLPGHITFINQLVYPGTIDIGIAGWELLWLAIVTGYFLWKRKILTGMLLAAVITIVVTRLISLPAWTFAQISFFHPLTLLVSDRTLTIAITKVIGYDGMILCTLALVATSRDAELIGTLRQLHIPQPVIFFLSTVFRALTLALSDYEIIHQAQVARAINARPRSFLKRLRDLGRIAVPMVAMMIRRSSEIGDALYARGYTLSKRSADFYEASPWRSVDWPVLVISLGLLLFAVLPHPTLTALLLH
jgi:energy-coupling factor transporter transmembrane protein EcfT